MEYHHGYTIDFLRQIILVINEILHLFFSSKTKRNIHYFLDPWPLKSAANVSWFDL